jgi:hypothetical protein
MTLNTEKWKDNVIAYVGEVKKVFGEWQSSVKSIEEITIGSTVEDLESKTKDIVTNSANLVEVVTGEGGVIDTLESEYDSVTKLTGGYALLRDALKGTITDYEDFIDLID